MDQTSQNPELAIEDLPAPEPRQWQSLQGTQAWLESLAAMPVILVLLGAIAGGTWGLDLHEPFQVLIACALAALLMFQGLIYPHIALRYRGFAVRERDIVFRSGWLWRRVSLVSYARIQHVETGQGPLQRRFGLSWIKLFTAGGALGDLIINGVSKEQAARIEEWIGQRITQQAADSAGPGEHDGGDGEAPDLEAAVADTPLTEEPRG